MDWSHAVDELSIFPLKNFPRIKRMFSPFLIDIYNYDEMYWCENGNITNSTEHMTIGLKYARYNLVLITSFFNTLVQLILCDMNTNITFKEISEESQFYNQTLLSVSLFLSNSYSFI